MQLNQAAREIIFKVVYYGPGMSGKTTNLAFLQQRATPGTASELITLDTHSERTLHFDWLALELGQIQGHNVRVEFHTVPGQSYYAATRKLVLTGADAVVFVADSRREALDENIASMNEMLDNLRQLGMPSQLPVVLQYNKQDLPTAVKPEQLDPLMNVRQWPSRGASALNGLGVGECAHDILAMLADAAAQASLPELPQEIAPRTWLISCHRCQAMLEVPDAQVGSIYTCGVCSATLEVIDPDRGLTRQPAPGATPVPPQARTQPQEPSNYAMKSLPTQQAEQEAASGSALTPQRRTPAPVSMGGGDFPLAGWEVMGFIDESPLGRRMRVRDMASGRTCRAMVLSAQIMAQPGYAEGLESYVRLAGPLKHPHVLPLLEMRPTGGTVVLLSADMPEHEPLGVVLGRRRALAPPHAMGILRQVVLALEDAARAGVVHGWLRPECVLVSPDGTVLVDEFAVPKNHRFLVRELAGASAATEYYLAPEHLGEDARSDLRSDMFLCGALLYRMITGDGLVTGYNAHEALHKLMAAGGKPLRAVGNTVSRDLDLFYRQLTALNRGERFENYRKLIEVLDRFGGGAKRQTLRLTQPIASGPRPQPGSGVHQRTASGTHLRPGTGMHNRPGTGMHNRPTSRPPSGQIAPQHRRTGSGEIVRPLPPPRRGGGGMAVAIVVIAVLVLVGAVAYVMLYHRPMPPAPTPAPTQRPVQPAPVQPAQPAPPPRPTTANTIGAVPPDQQPAEPAPPVQPRTEPKPPAQATLPPAPPPEPPAPEMTPAQRRDLLNKIADLLLEERFQAAQVEAEKLPNPEDRPQIVAKRDARRAELEQRARTVGELAIIQAMLRPALDGTWGMPGDREWARGQLDQAEARLAGAATPAQPAQPPPVQPTPTVPVVQPAPPTPAPDAPTADPALAVLSALAKGELAAAEASAATAPEGQPDGRALRLAVASYPHRATLLDRVAKARSAKLRLTHPTTRESVDLVAATATAIEVSAPGGATSSLNWGQVGARELGRLLGDAASAPGAVPDDHAAAITGLIIGGDAALAAVHLRRFRAQLPAERAADLDGLIAIGKRAEAQILLARAAEAQKAGQTRLLADCLTELRKPDRAAIPVVAAALPRLEAALKDLQEGRSATAARLSDRVAFDAPADLAQFPDSAGTWQVAAGAAANADPARLGRRDAGTAKSVQVIFTPTAKRGTVSIDFKGLKLSFDLAAGQFTAHPAEKPAGAPKPCSILERVPHIVYLAYLEDGNHLTVELNSQILADVVMGDLAETFAFTAAAGAIVQVDEVVFARADAADPGKAALRKLGWEPLGKATLDEKAGGIVLTGAPQATAGITAQVPANTVGYTMDVKGDGNLRLQLTGTGGTQHADIKLTAGTATRLSLRWAAGNFVILDGDGVPMHSAKLDRPVTAVSVIASGPCTIALPIRPNRQ